jgi:hypothetical protein
MDESLWRLLTVLGLIMGACVVIALIGLFALTRSIRRLRVPPHADFFTTMRYIPLPLVILLDLLDFGLDIFSAPIIWIALDRMGLPNLRNKATIEALIPFTNVIPTFTASWFATRLLNLGDQPQLYEPDYWEPRDERMQRRPPRRPTIIDADDPRYR